MVEEIKKLDVEAIKTSIQKTVLAINEFAAIASNMVKQQTPNFEMKALSWKQPFAELMLHGKIETRTWSTKYRGWVLLCCSKKSYSIDELILIQNSIQNLCMYDWLLSQNPHLEGKAFAVGRLVACRKMTPEDENLTFVNYNPNLYCHIYEDVLPIEPFPWKGSQGWRNVPDEVKMSIQLKMKQ